MTASKNKTTPTDKKVSEFLATVESQKRRDDADVLIKLFSDISGHPPVMWGPSIIGFGNYHYIYESGREGDMPEIGLSPRKSSLVLYIYAGFDGGEQYKKSLGKVRVSKACVYVNKLEDISMDTLKEFSSESIKYLREDGWQ
ncbi:MAG: DUF1801 domain-containing protein [Patescibacteria group bacterium]